MIYPDDWRLGAIIDPDWDIYRNWFAFEQELEDRGEKHKILYVFFDENLGVCLTQKNEILYFHFLIEDDGEWYLREGIETAADWLAEMQKLLHDVNGWLMEHAIYTKTGWKKI